MIDVSNYSSLIRGFVLLYECPVSCLDRARLIESVTRGTLSASPAAWELDTEAGTPVVWSGTKGDNDHGGPSRSIKHALVIMVAVARAQLRGSPGNRSPGAALTPQRCLDGAPGRIQVREHRTGCIE